MLAARTQIRSRRRRSATPPTPPPPPQLLQKKKKKPPGTPFTSFTGTTVQLLTLRKLQGSTARRASQCSRAITSTSGKNRQSGAGTVRARALGARAATDFSAHVASRPERGGGESKISVLQHTSSAYVRTRQHTSAHGSKRQHTRAARASSVEEFRPQRKRKHCCTAVVSGWHDYF